MFKRFSSNRYYVFKLLISFLFISRTFHFTNLKEYGSSANTYLSLFESYVLFPLFGFLSYWMHQENVCVILKFSKKYNIP